MKTRVCILKSIVIFLLIFITVNVYPQGVLNNGGKITLGTGSYLTIKGAGINFTNASLNGDGTIDNDGTIYLQGNFTNNAGGGVVFINSNTLGTVEFNGTSLSNITGAVSFENMIVNNIANVKLQSNTTINKSLSLTNGTFNLNGKTLNLVNDAVIYKTAGSLSAAPVFAGMIDVVYNENASPIATGYELPDDASKIRDFTINNSNGVQLYKDITINRTLDFDAGKIEILVYDIKLASNATITGYDSTKYIIAGGLTWVFGAGRLTRFIKNTTATADQVFPLGTSTSYTPCYISNSNTTGTNYNVNLFEKVMAKGTNGTEITTQVIKRTWDIIPDNEPNANPTTLKLQWNVADEATNFQRSSITISKNRHFAGIDEAWTELTGTYTRQIDTPPYWVSVNGISTFLNFAGGTKSSEDGSGTPLGEGGSPLPISLLSFTTFCNGDNNVLNWSTATETNNDYFTIEKSMDANEWNSCGIVKGAGNSNEQISYSFFEKGSANIVYYRLKQTDFDGHYSYSKTISSEPCYQNHTSIISIYPNPFNDNVTINFNSLSEEDVDINVINIAGEKVYTKLAKSIIGKNLVMLNLSELENGTYLLYLSNSPKESFKIVKQ